LTTSEPEEQGRTAPIELPTPAATPAPHFAATEPAASVPSRPDLPPGEPRGLTGEPADRATYDAPLVARAALPMQQEVLYVPLAVSIGDGFKFGCGFFLASVLAMLVGFVLVAALFVLTSLFGLSLPIAR
jgi:hypothetical protein